MNIIHIVLEAVFKLAMFFVSIILAVIAAFLAAMPFAKLQEKATKELKGIRRARLHEITRKAAEHLHKFYGLREPYIVTKCYDSSDRKFKNKDVTRYTFAVTNYQGYEGTVYANVLFYRNRVIGGDICSADISGFVHGFEK